MTATPWPLGHWGRVGVAPLVVVEGEGGATTSQSWLNTRFSTFGPKVTTINRFG